MKWLKRLLGIKSQREKLLEELKLYEKRAFEAQRQGDMEEAGKWQKKVEAAEDALTNDFLDD
jgi:hypothetical protein